MIDKITRLMEAETDRHLKAVVALISRNPEHRAHFAFALLGGAIALCDTFGLDVEGFLAELRTQEPKPEVLVPPREAQS